MKPGWSGRLRYVACAGATALLAGACGTVGASEAVTLAVNPWTGHEVDSAIAQVVLENEVGADVETVDIDENAAWPGMADGDIDANLEVWPSGHQDDIDKYIRNGDDVIDGGELGVIGIIGWYTPTYLVEEHPELATYEGIHDNAELFATAETGDQGQFLAADPSYVSYDKQIIENLDLPLEVVQTGSEAASLASLESAYEDEEPILMYFYEPHWAHAVYDLTQVELPPYSDECYEEVSQIDCGYPEDVLMKVFNAELPEKAPEAYELLSNMQLTNEQQNEVAAMIEVDDMDPEEAAEAWVEDNEAVWSEWLPQ